MDGAGLALFTSVPSVLNPYRVLQAYRNGGRETGVRTALDPPGSTREARTVNGVTMAHILRLVSRVLQIGTVYAIVGVYGMFSPRTDRIAPDLPDRIGA